MINISTDTIICYCLLLRTIVLSKYYYIASYLLLPYVFKLIQLIAYNLHTYSDIYWNWSWHCYMYENHVICMQWYIYNGVLH